MIYFAQTNCQFVETNSFGGGRGERESREKMADEWKPELRPTSGKMRKEPKLVLPKRGCLLRSRGHGDFDHA